MRELNEAQQRLVEENHNLIYSFLESRGLSLEATEDWYGTAAIGLCKAALVFDESRGVKFSTLAYIVMDNEVKQVKRKNRKEVFAPYSLDEEINEEGTLRMETIEDPDDCFASIFLTDAILSSIGKLKERDRKIVLALTRDGHTQKETAELLGVSRQIVSITYQRYLENIRKYLQA